MVAAYEFMYVTPGIQNLIRENKSFRIDSEIQTGKRYGMQLLDDNLYNHFAAGRISAEEAIDKSKFPGGMVDKMRRNGFDVESGEDLPPEEGGSGGEEAGGGGQGAPKPPTPPGAAPAMSDAERQAQIQKNRERMMAMKK